MQKTDFILLMLGCLLSSQAWGKDSDFYDPVNWSLPPTIYSYLKDSRDYVIDSAINPVYQRLDFKGNGKLDFVALVKNRTNGKRGFLICPGKATPSTHGQNAKMQWLKKHCEILFAGNPVEHVGGKPSDNLNRMDMWQIYEYDSINTFPESPPPPKAKGEILLFGRSETASRLLYWIDRKFITYQAGD